MGDTTMMDTDQIRSTISKLDGIVSSIRKNVATAKEALNSLDKGWKHEDVKTAFFTKARKDLEAMTEMEEQYAEMSELLREAASEFDRNEEEVASSFSSLRV